MKQHPALEINGTEKHDQNKEMNESHHVDETLIKDLSSSAESNSILTVVKKHVIVPE